jgi:4-hydroxybenzoate polyprenyltransferase
MAGFSMMLPLLGAAVVSPMLGGLQLITLAAVGLAFHVFGYLSNDLFDLAIDRTQALRASSPLVRGLVRPAVALWSAFIPVPVVSAIEVATGRPVAGALLMVGMGFGLIYNAYGKRMRCPILGDAAQALAWVALAGFGACSTGLPLTAPFVLEALTIFCYVMLVNTFHGGLRDLENDSRHDARTTARFLGARYVGDVLIVPRAVFVYGLLLQLLLLSLGVLHVTNNWPANSEIPWQGMLALIVGGHIIMLRLAQTALGSTSTRAEMLRAGILHLVLSMGIVCLPFAFLANTSATIAIIVCYILPPMLLVMPASQ